MAKACTKAYKANIGIGVTGTMGNADPANLEASVPGQVYFAITLNGEAKSYYIDGEIIGLWEYACEQSVGIIVGSS